MGLFYTERSVEKDQLFVYSWCTWADILGLGTSSGSRSWEVQEPPIILRFYDTSNTMYSIHAIAQIAFYYLESLEQVLHK